MLKAQIIEKYRKTGDRTSNETIQTIIHESRYFTDLEQFTKWYDTFKEELWEDEPTKVKLKEGIYVAMEMAHNVGDDVELNNTEKPKRLSLYASYREGISYKYAY